MKRAITFIMLVSLALAACSGGEVTPTVVPTALPTAPQATAVMVVAATATTASGVPAGPVIAHLEAGKEVFMRYVSMFDQLRGWAVGAGVVDTGDDYILKTYDSGQTWLDVTPPEPASEGGKFKYAAAYFSSLEQGVVTYYPTDPVSQPSIFWLTNDGGKTWQPSQPLDAQGLEAAALTLEKLYFANNQYGWLLLKGEPGAGQSPAVLYGTRDGGASWERLIDPNSNDKGSIGECCRTGMAFMDDKVGLITSVTSPNPKPHFNITRDGGKTWQPIELLPADEELFSRSLCGTFSPSVLSTQSLALVVECTEFIGMEQKYTPYLYVTNDQGNSWAWVSVPVTPLAEGKWEKIEREQRVMFFDAQNGWFLIEDVYTGKDPKNNMSLTQVYKTSDGGQTWTRHKKNFSWIGQYSFLNLDVGWAIAKLGKVPSFVKTTDGGGKWVELFPTIRDE
ncbi:MAG: hypothetical protein AB1894_05265 [Chloroflexota bacterium]